MKHMTKLFKSALLMLALGLCFSCNQKGVEYKQNSENESVNQNENNVVTAPGDWLVVKMAGQEMGKFSKNKENPHFYVQGVEYQSKLKGDKRKYAGKGGEIIAEVKYKDDAFKVRNPDGKLLWKIKLYDDKVKISDNEENLNPYEIKPGDPGKAKLKKNDNTLGTIKLKESDKQVEITADSKSYYVETENFSLAYAVLLIDEMPEYIRYIIVAELLAKGK